MKKKKYTYEEKERRGDEGVKKKNRKIREYKRRTRKQPGKYINNVLRNYYAL